MLLFGAFVMCFGLSAAMFLGGDNDTLLPLRVAMAVVAPLVIVGAAFMAGEVRTGSRPWSYVLPFRRGVSGTL